MTTNENIVWGIHAGKYGEAEDLFLLKGFIALGWGKIGDLKKIPANRENFKNEVQKAYPEDKPGSIPVSAGQLFRFLYEMKVGDYVVFPSRKDRQINIGKVMGEYIFQPNINREYPNMRSVVWLKNLPRTYFSQGALYEIGSAMSFFQVKNFADEFLSALEGIIIEPVDKTINYVAEDIEQQSRDFVLKQLAINLKGIPLEEFVRQLLEVMGYQAHLSRMNEPSVDIIAHKDELGFEPPIIKVQVKSQDGKISDKDVSALYGKIGAGEFGLMVTLGEYTPPALTFANSKSNLRLIDGDDLVDLIFEHYEGFDPKYKGIIPLKRVYIPQPFEK